MKIFDEKLKTHIGHYLFQCAMAAATLGLVLHFLDVFINTAVVASLGATSFIVFTMPHTKKSKARYIIGGYSVGLVVGVIFHQLLLHPTIAGSVLSAPAIGAMAVGVAMFIMVITNTEHPPAAALALGLTINGFTLYTLLVVYVVALSLIVVRRVFSRWFIDLL